MTLPWHVLSFGGPYLSALSVLFMSASLASPPHPSRTVEKEMQCSSLPCAKPVRPPIHHCQSSNLNHSKKHFKRIWSFPHVN